MNIKTFVIRGIVGSIINFLLGGFLYAYLFSDYLSSHSGSGASAYRPADNLIIWAMFLSCLAYGFLLSYVLTSSNVPTLKQGVLAGAIVGFLYALCVNFNFFATTTLYTAEGIVADTIIFTLMSAVIGAAISLIGRRDKAIA